MEMEVAAASTPYRIKPLRIHSLLSVAGRERRRLYWPGLYVGMQMHYADQSVLDLDL